VTYFLTPAKSNAKTAKTSEEVESVILHLAPSDLSGRDVCPFASAGCRAACLNTSGRGTMKGVQSARLRKTNLLFDDKTEFWRLLVDDLDRLEKRAEKKGLSAAARLNGTSDLPWERMREPNSGLTVFEMFPAIVFYDYTKVPGRRNLPSNYHLTFSLSENNEALARAELADGVNVAVVFDSGDYPSRFMGFPVIDGSESDLRYLDPIGYVVALCAKGKAKQDRSGFVKKVALA
jgi:hypothetical protein